MMASADNHKTKAALRRRVLAQEPDYYIRLLFTRNSWKQVLMTSLGGYGSDSGSSGAPGWALSLAEW